MSGLRAVLRIVTIVLLSWLLLPLILLAGLVLMVVVGLEEIRQRRRARLHHQVRFLLKSRSPA